MQTFVTIFPDAHNYHLTKDIGQIPYFMGAFRGYDSKLVCYQNSPSYPHTLSEVKNLELAFIKEKGSFLFAEKAVLKFLKKNARKIDVLNLYHLSKPTLVYGILYKLLNPSGKLYLKADIFNPLIESGGYSYSKSKFKNGLLKYLEWKFMQKADLITVENKKGVDLMKESYPYAKGKIKYLTNGVNDVFLKNNFPSTKSYEEKDDVIIVSGRIGVDFKKHHYILEAALKLNFKNWKIVFAGPVQEEFKKVIDEFFQKHPRLKENLVFLGDINDRLQLYELYDGSKICCLSSESESFGLVYSEAMYFGNYLIGTEGMSAFDDLSNNGEFGDKLSVGDVDALAKTLQGYIDSEDKLRQLTPLIKEHCLKNFNWSGLTKKLDQYLKEAGNDK